MLWVTYINMPLWQSLKLVTKTKCRPGEEKCYKPQINCKWVTQGRRCGMPHHTCGLKHTGVHTHVSKQPVNSSERASIAWMSNTYTNKSNFLYVVTPNGIQVTKASLIWLALWENWPRQGKRRKEKSKSILVIGRGRPWIVRRRGSHILWTVRSERAVRLPALRVGCALPPRKIPGTHFC
jgi:hypothetical protein